MTILLESTGPRLPVLSARERIAYWAIAAALVLHAVIAIVCIVDWAALLDLALARAEVPEAIPVTLVYTPPPPPPPPPQPVVQPQPTQPQPPITPRMSGADEKTEAKQEDTPQPALPQPKSPPPQPAPQQKNPTPARPGNRDPASVTAEREAALEPETRKQAQPAPLFHSIRLPSQRGGTGERDTAGDAYLNKMKDVVERHRIYPPASAFLGGEERLVILSVLIEPSGELVQVRLQVPSGSTLADEAAANMIRVSAPFGPIPASYPHIRTSITVEMPIYPTPR